MLLLGLCHIRSWEFNAHLHVSNVQVFPDISCHDIPQFVKVVLMHEVRMVSIAARNILVDPVEVQTK